MAFKLEIETGNAAFEPHKAEECARILRAIADKLDDGYAGGKAIDLNGNTVGEWLLSFGDDE